MTPAATVMDAAEIVVSREPSAGRRMKDASAAPAAAPSVLAAYKPPAAPARRRGSTIAQREATGNVAPRAAAGTPSSATTEQARTIPKESPPSPSAYAAASSGWSDARPAGTASAQAATMNSM